VPDKGDQKTPVEVVDPSQAFAEIFRDRKWGGDIQSFSGTGANLEQTRVVRDELPKLCAELGVVRLLDIPCGDFSWMQHTDLTGISYIGADIVKEIVDRNAEQFGNGTIGRQFLHLNLCEDPLPDADLILCRDCLVHLSNNDVFKALRNIHRSHARYLLTTTFANRDQNVDIPTGEWRTLDLSLEPFLFPSPTKIINERCTLSGNDYADKSLALWRIQDLSVESWGSGP
jgi:hypothetical protein